MAVVETEQHGEIFVIRMNRPEALNALNSDLRAGLSDAWNQFEDSKDLEVAIFTGSGRGFCAGEDMKEALQAGKPGFSKPTAKPDPFMKETLTKPVIGAINGFAMGGGFMLVEKTDLRVAVKGTLFEMSEAKRWMLGGWNHGQVANLPFPIATEMAFAFRIPSERMYELGFVNRLVEPDELMPEAFKMAEHLLTLPPAARVNTLHMMKTIRPNPAEPYHKLAKALHEHGALSDRMESRAAFAEKRKPVWKGWEKPEDRYNMPTLESVQAAEK